MDLRAERGGREIDVLAESTPHRLLACSGEMQLPRTQHQRPSPQQ